MRESAMNFPNVSPSLGLKFFTKCSSKGPFHGVQSFRSRLLQHGPPTRSQALPENLLECGLLSPRVHRSCQEPAPAWTPQGSRPPSGHIHLLWRGVLHRLQVHICCTMDLSMLQGESLPYHGLHQGLQGNLCSGTCSPSFFTDLGVYRVVSFSYSHSFIPAVFFSLFLNVLSQRCLAKIGLAFISSRSVLETAGIGSIGHSKSF